MYQRILKILLITTVSVGLLACATTAKYERQQEKQLLNAGATRLGPEQVTAYLSGKTQVWDNGGAYFLPNGTVYVKWGGKVFPERRWIVDNRGKVCVQFLDGRNSSCSTYFDLDGKVWVVTLEIFGERLSDVRSFKVRRDGSVDADDKSIHGGPDEVMEGNRLAEI